MAESRYIWDAVDACVIKPFNEDTSRKLMKSTPFWACIVIDAGAPDSLRDSLERETMVSKEAQSGSESKKV